jgi:hypothetical protein
MKIKVNEVDTVFYIIACIISCGLVWIVRVILSVAIRCALSNKEI